MANILFDALFQNHESTDKPFLVTKDDAVITYSHFLELTAQIAHTLTKSNVTPGDRVAVQVQKSPQALAVYAACIQSGAVFLPLNTAYTPSEIEYFVSDAEPKLVICDAKSEAALAPIADKNNAGLHTLNADGSGSLTEAAAKEPASFDTIDRAENDLAAILYTSGTTGRSKGAMLSHLNLLSNAQSLIEYWKFTEKDTLLHALPIFHTHGLFVATNVSLLAGGTMIFLPGF
ncbi:MAG: AMP-binding protein, partial [Methyloligellaceae bacterium]